MLFKSPHAAMRFNVRPPLVTYHPVTGVVIGETPAVVAEFGQTGDEFVVVGPGGEQETVANINGHFFDSENAAAENGWSDEVRESVETLLLMKCRTVPMFISLVEKIHVAAPRPWATYDDLEPAQIVEAALLLNLVPETLLYENENRGRPAVVEPLEERMLELNEASWERMKPHEDFAPGALDVQLAGPDAPLVVAQPPTRTDGGITTV